MALSIEFLPRRQISFLSFPLSLKMSNISINDGDGGF